jgi:hypothetical protein
LPIPLPAPVTKAMVCENLILLPPLFYHNFQPALSYPVPFLLQCVSHWF